MTLFFDTDRQLPFTDPLDRQLTIGLGCFLEMMKLAASANGYAVDLDLFPKGYSATALDERPVAHARFQPSDTSTDPLWDAVPDRRSNKEPFDTSKPVDPSVLTKILSVVRTAKAKGTVEEDMVKALRKLTNDALLVEIETPHTYKESVDLFRIGKREVNANPDGIDFSGFGYEAMAIAGMFNREVTLDTSTIAYREGVKAVLSNCTTAMGHIWLVTETNTRIDQIAVGADWLRLNLATTQAGLGLQPMSQALQEYPEMARHYADVHEMLAPGGGTVQMLGRIGHGINVSPSPRWSINEKLVTT